MKIAVPSANGGGLEDKIAPVFARAPVFTVVDVENGEIKSIKVIQNQAAYAGGGAGPIAVQTLINEGVDTIIAPQIGPNVMGALQAAGITYYLFPAGTPIKEAVEKVIKEGMQQTAQQTYLPAVPANPAPAYLPYGYGWEGRGRGFGKGFGRGWGRGRGWGGKIRLLPLDRNTK